MFTKAIGFFSFLLFLLSGITWVSGTAGQGIGGRVIAADIFGVLLISLVVLVILVRNNPSFSSTRTHNAFLPLLCVFLLGALFADFPQKTLFELLVLVFSFTLSIALFNLWSIYNVTLEDILRYLLYAGAILAFVGLLQFFIFKELFSGSFGGLSGTFRNTGQAGAFFGVLLAILIPGLISGKINGNFVNFICLSLIFFALVFTLKRAALIGFSIGCILIFLKLLLSTAKKDKLLAVKVICSALVLIIPSVFFMIWGLDNVNGLMWRFGNKINSDAIEDFSEGFLAENIRYTLTAFDINPIIGVGLGNVAGIISPKYEIHSTYMAILATSGLSGVMAYIYFIFTWLKTLLSTSKLSENREFLVLLTLMSSGLLVSWCYTYHLRKREFWILLTISMYAYYKSQREAN